MKKVYLFILIGMICGINSYSQQSHISLKNTSNEVYPMVIFPKNSPQTNLTSDEISKKIQFELFSNESFKNKFSSNIMKNSIVISCSYDGNFKAGTLVNLNLSPEADFDFLKSLLISNEIKYVSIEDTIIPIENWHPFTSEQLTVISHFNNTITNIELKKNWVLQNEEEYKLSLKNGWMNQSDSLLSVAKKDKINYLRNILK